MKRYCSLEQRLFAHRFGLPLNKWADLRFLVEKALLEGVIDRVREEVLRHYAQEKLQLIAREGAICDTGRPKRNTSNSHQAEITRNIFRRLRASHSSRVSSIRLELSAGPCC